MRKLTKNLGDVITHAMSAVENADLDYNHQSMSLSSWFSHGKTWYGRNTIIKEKWNITKMKDDKSRALCYFGIWATSFVATA